jgi:hypothetical protein
MKTFLTLSLLLPSFIFADPCGMVPPVYLTPGSPQLTRVGDQLTFVFFKDGIQDIVLRPGFSGQVNDFGMLIPFPAVPALRKVSDDIFNHLEKAVHPPEVVVYIAPFRIVNGVTDLRLKESDEASELELRGEVKVLKEEAVGMYQIAVLEAKNPRALSIWMEAHGYIYPKGMDEPCKDYIKEGWCFVAVKANIGSKSAAEPRPGMRSAENSSDAGFSGAVQAMGFRFRAESPVVPMRLSAFNQGKLFNRVYVLSDQHLRFKQLPGKFIKERISGDKLYKNMTQPLPVRVVGGTLEQAEKMGLLKQPKYNRDPSPHNGHALDAFTSDLLSIKTGKLSHPFEEREKELLKIGERLGMRGKEVDELIGQVIRKERRAALQDVENEFKKLVLTVIEGDFPRNVIAKENLTLVSFDPKVFPNVKDAAVHRRPTPVGDVYAIEQAPTEAKRAESEISIPTPNGYLVSFGAACLLGAVLLSGSRKLLIVALTASALLMSQSSAFAKDLDKNALINDLSNPERAEVSAATLIAMGGAAVPLLQGEAVEGSDLSRRGWAIVCLADIGDKRAVNTLQLINKDKQTPDLVKMWANAALLRIRGMETIRDLLRETAKDPSKQKMVSSVILGMRAGAVRPLVKLAVTGETQQDRMSATSWLGALDGRLRGGIVRKVLLAELSYSKAQAEKGVPWQGGPLYLPRYRWTQAEALAMTRQLVCWLIWAEQKGKEDIVGQILNNLRDLSWRTGLGFRRGGTGFTWAQSLLTQAGKDASAVNPKTDPNTLILILQLLDEASN